MNAFESRFFVCCFIERDLNYRVGTITVSTDTVQQLCHSSNLQLQKSAPCTDIHGTQGSQVQILYHKLVLWY